MLCLLTVPATADGAILPSDEFSVGGGIGRRLGIDSSGVFCAELMVELSTQCFLMLMFLKKTSSKVTTIILTHTKSRVLNSMNLSKFMKIKC